MEKILDKKILIWGYGIEGKSALSALLKRETTHTIFVATKEKLNINDIENTKFIVEDEILNYEFDIVIKSSGISKYKKKINLLEKNGSKIITIFNLFLLEVNMYSKRPKIIGITGTKGKSTTASIANHILNSLGYKSLLVGNIGVAVLDALDKFQTYDYIIIELSSYQCANLDNNKYIDYGIVLNLYPEHIDWHLNHENYYLDKLNLANSSKKLIVNKNDTTIKKFLKTECDYFGNVEGFYLNNNSVYFKDKKLFETSSINNLIGEHIFLNICSVLTILKMENINLNDAIASLKTFKSLPHRLETLNIGNTIFVDDSISTIPEATIKAIDCFKNKDIYLILGGFDRQQDYTILIDKIKKSEQIKKVFLLGQTGKRIFNLLKDYKNPYKYFNSLEDIMSEVKNDLDNKVILLSPASPSYDMFKNFEERGELFKNLAKKLLNI